MDCRVREYVKDNIKVKKCSKYIANHKNNRHPLEEVCCCGRPKTWHIQNEPHRSNSSGEELWDKTKHTELLDNCCYGKIEFQGVGQREQLHAPYVRVADNTDLEKLWDLLVNKWCIHHPKLLISVTGGAKKFNLKSRLKTLFKRGLIKAATSTGAWIITGGTNAGVMKLVGEAVREHRMSTFTELAESDLVVLGIATWGIVDNKDSLKAGDRDGLFPALYKKKTSGDSSQELSALDHYHTHFILVDDGTENQFGAEIKMRAALEEYISNETIESSDMSCNIPVVLLVLEGGPNTLKTAAESVKNKVPVVIIQHSGRAADLIAFACKIVNSKERSQFKKEIKDKAMHLFQWKDGNNKELQECIMDVEQLLHEDNKELVTVFNLNDEDSTKDVDQAILNALLKGKKSDVAQQLDLALVWNCCDAARKEIFDADHTPKIDDEKLNDSMLKALSKGQADFVQLFLDSDFDLRAFVDTERLKMLYPGKKDNVMEKCHLAGTSYDLLRRLLPENQEDDVLTEVGRLIIYLLDGQVEQFYTDSKSTEKLETGSQRKRKLEPERELFLWSVLLNRKDLAKLFWQRGKDHIGSALTACVLLQSMSAEAYKEEETDLACQLKEHSRLFEKRATGVLAECYQRNKSMAHQLLVRKLDIWGNTTLFTLADSGKMMEFLGHACSQTMLNKIWKGNMALHTPMWQIVLGLFFPFMLLFINFEPESSPGENQVWSTNQVSPDDAEMQTGRVERFKKLKYSLYYYKAPVTKFLYHTISYAVYLGLFSFFLMTDLRPISHEHSPGAIEYIVLGWTVSLFAEEMRQIVTSNQRFFTHKTKGYFSNTWNRVDLAIFVMFGISVTLRFVLDETNFVWARMCYAITLAMCFLRSTQVLFVNKVIGPKLVMIEKMMTDLAFFLVILVIFMTAYGIASQTLRYPNAPVSWSLLKDIFYLPYWQMYGELYLDRMEGDVEGCSHNETIWRNDQSIPRCPHDNWLAIVLFAVYMLLVNILLLNLLIAMFRDSDRSRE